MDSVLVSQYKTILHFQTLLFQQLYVTEKCMAVKITTLFFRHSEVCWVLHVKKTNKQKKQIQQAKVQKKKVSRSTAASSPRCSANFL